jgi:sialate O-acetylesterase
MNTLRLLFLATLLLNCHSLFAEVRLPQLFSDHMVLQRNKPIKIWGWADANEAVTIVFKKQKVQTRADASGNWVILLKKEKAGGPFVLQINGEKNSFKLNDVLLGDVWVCSGQSNMEWPLKLTDGASDEIKSANHPNIRHIKIPHFTSFLPEKDFQPCSWQVCSPKSAADFSAVAYYFAKKVQQETGVPVGLINSSWGGTHCETWMSKDMLMELDFLKKAAAELPTSKEEEQVKWRTKMEAQIAGFQNTVENEHPEQWHLPSYDDQNWSELEAPKLWESQGLPGFDGTVWYRKQVPLTENQANGTARLYLGMIDDCDSVYVNGIKIGVTCNWDTPRIYEIGPNILKPGANLIAIKVIDWGGGGGIYGDAEAIRLYLPNHPIPLAGKWKARVDMSAVTIEINPNSYATLLYNAMIHPMLPFSIKGAIWYQGESNVSRAAQYDKTFRTMINGWRRHWKQGDFPFYFVQLASFLPLDKNTLEYSEWAELRQSQYDVTKLRRTGMAVATDIGDANDIHPRNKKDVGQRLAFHALKNDYKKRVVPYGPQLHFMKVVGNTAELTFVHRHGGLSTKVKGDELQGFAIAGPDQKFINASAIIKGKKILVSSKDVPTPVAVRYGWVDNPEKSNLFNKAGLPASPFRTDNWPYHTVDGKF